MEFKVIFSPHQEYLIEREFIDFNERFLKQLGGSVTSRKTRILPERRHIGIYILDLYRRETGDDQVSINDLPRSIAGNWRDNKYVSVSINEETARVSGGFLEYDTFYCEASLDVMMEFETVDIVDKDTEDPKLIISIDKDEILKEWIKQGYPEELRMPEETEPEESEN